MRSRRGKGTAAICAATLLLAGCGSAEEEREKRSEDERAKAALITRDDLPADWSPSPDSGDETTTPSKAEVARMCPGYPADWMVVKDSDADVSFETATASLMHAISLYGSERPGAREWFDDFDSPRARRCMTGIVRTGLEEGLAADPELAVEFGEITARALDLPEGQRGTRVAVEMSAPDGSVTVPVEAEIVLAEAGGALSMLMLMAVDQPLDEALRDRVAATASERLEQQFG